MNQNLIAKASIEIEAPVEQVWNALTTPQIIKQYMFGTTVVSDFKVGSSITWSGVWNGKPYEDRGKILTAEVNKVISYSHFSPMMGQPDLPENYHNVTIELKTNSGPTVVTLTQDNNENEAAQQHSQQNWELMLKSLKKILE